MSKPPLVRGGCWSMPPLTESATTAACADADDLPHHRHPQGHPGQNRQGAGGHRPCHPAGTQSRIRPFLLTFFPPFAIIKSIVKRDSVAGQTKALYSTSIGRWRCGMTALFFCPGTFWKEKCYEPKQHSAGFCQIFFPQRPRHARHVLLHPGGHLLCLPEFGDKPALPRSIWPFPPTTLSTASG